MFIQIYCQVCLCSIYCIFLKSLLIFIVILYVTFWVRLNQSIMRRRKIAVRMFQGIISELGAHWTVTEADDTLWHLTLINNNKSMRKYFTCKKNNNTYLHIFTRYLETLITSLFTRFNKLSNLTCLKFSFSHNLCSWHTWSYALRSYFVWCHGKDTTNKSRKILNQTLVMHEDWQRRLNVCYCCLK